MQHSRGGCRAKADWHGACRSKPAGRRQTPTNLGGSAAKAGGRVRPTKEGCLPCGRWRSSDCFLEFLGRAEGDFLAGFNLDRLAGGRIAAHTRGALTHHQNAEAADADAVALLQMLSDG